MLLTENTANMRLNEPLPPSRRLALQKKYKFGDTWIMLSRELGEALMLSSMENNWKRSTVRTQTSSRIARKRRKAVTVVNLSTRLMTNGQRWPTENDWQIGPDKLIRYVPASKPVEKLKSAQKIGGHIVDEATKLPVVTGPVAQQPEKATEDHLSNASETRGEIVFGSTRLSGIELIASKVIATEDVANESLSGGSASDPEFTTASSGNDLGKISDMSYNGSKLVNASAEDEIQSYNRNLEHLHDQLASQNSSRETRRDTNS